MPVGLHAAGHDTSSPSSAGHQPQPLPIQPIRPIQPVQGIPQSVAVVSPTPVINFSNLPQVLPTGSAGVSFTPQGRGGYSKMSHTGGSIESLNSLNSTQSLTLSIGSSTSTGKDESLAQALSTRSTTFCFVLLLDYFTYFSCCPTFGF